MSLNKTPSADRIHIGFFGKRNAGKSSVVNAVTGQELAVVSQIKGTTTDPVWKAMELLPLGPVVVIDTPGIDDEGDLGALRVRKARQILNKTDVAVLIVDGTVGITAPEQELLDIFQEKQIPYVVAFNKEDLIDTKDSIPGFSVTENTIRISAKTGFQIEDLKEKIGQLTVRQEPERRIVGELLNPLDLVVLVTPIDKAAPKGRLILPQQQTIRDILDSDAIAVTVKENQLKSTLEQLKKQPAMVITDSQVFGKVNEDVPRQVPLTSFSILFARYKGSLETVVQGAAAIETLQDRKSTRLNSSHIH